MTDDAITIERDSITLTIEAPDVDTAAVAEALDAYREAADTADITIPGPDPDDRLDPMELPSPTPTHPRLPPDGPYPRDPIVPWKRIWVSTADNAVTDSLWD